MKVKVFTFFDCKVGAYMQPFFAQSPGAALRILLGSIERPDHILAKHPADFTLFELGEFDDQLGQFTNLHTPMNLGTVLSHMPAPATVTPMRGRGYDHEKAREEHETAVGMES